MSGNGRRTGIRQSTKPTRRRRAAFRKIRAADREAASYDPSPAEYQNSAQGAQRRLAPVRSQLLPPLSSGRAPRRAGRHLHKPCGLSVRHQKSTERKRVMSKDRGRAKSEDGMALNREGLKRRDLLLERHVVGGRFGTVGCGYCDLCASAATSIDAANRETAEHCRHHGRRHWHVEHRRLSPRHDGRADAEHRQARRRRHAVHRLLRRGELHGGPGAISSPANCRSAPA